MPDHSAAEISNLIRGFICGQKSFSETCDDVLKQETNMFSQQEFSVPPIASNKTQATPGRKTFQCSSCGKMCDNYKQLKVHKYQVHPLNYGTIKCEICSKILKTKSSLINHMFIHNSSSFACPKCSTKFNRKFALTRHKKTCKFTDCFV